MIQQKSPNNDCSPKDEMRKLDEVDNNEDESDSLKDFSLGQQAAEPGVTNYGSFAVNLIDFENSYKNQMSSANTYSLSK